MPSSKNSSDSKGITEPVIERLAIAAMSKALGGSLSEAAEMSGLPRRSNLLYDNVRLHSRLFRRLRRAADTVLRNPVMPSSLQAQILRWMDEAACRIATDCLTLQDFAKDLGVHRNTFYKYLADNSEAWNEALKKHGLHWDRPGDEQPAPLLHNRARLRKAAQWAVLGFPNQFISRELGMSGSWLKETANKHSNYWRDLTAEAAKAWGIPEGCFARTVIRNAKGKAIVYPGRFTGGRRTPAPAGKKNVPPSPATFPPNWDKDKGALRMGRRIIRKVDLARAPNLVAILDAFADAENKWAPMIPDPLCGPSGQANPERLKAAVKALNHGLTIIRFGTEGGDTVTWRKR